MLLSYTNMSEMAIDFTDEYWDSLLDSIPTEMVKETPVKNDEGNDSLSASIYLPSSVYLSPRACARARGEESNTHVARACELTAQELPWEQTGRIYEAYQGAFGRNHIAMSVRKDIAELMSAGADASLIIKALETAVDAPRPSWAYARATVQRCLSEGVYNGEAFEQRKARYKARSAQNFAQRQIEAEEFESGFYVDVMGNKSGGR